MRKANECAQPGRCIVHSRPTFSGKRLSPASLQRFPRRRRVSPGGRFPATLQPPHVSCSKNAAAPCRWRLWVPVPQAQVPRPAVEHSGHAQVPTLLVALVRRQAGRAGWRRKIGSKNTENQKFETDRRYQFEGFAFQNILKGRLYLFIIQKVLFVNTREHKNSITL